MSSGRKQSPPRTHLICPRCGSDHVLPIVYGLVLTPDSNRDVFYGGCIVGEGMPTHRCADCEYGFGFLQERDPSDSFGQTKEADPRMEDLEQRDALMASLIPWVAEHLVRHPEKDSFPESLIEGTLIEGVETLIPGGRAERTGRRDVHLPHWVGKLKDVDVKIWLPAESQPSILVEAKVDEVDQTLWDLLKLVEAPFIEGVVAGYLVVAAVQRRWNSDRDCVDLFRSDLPKEWKTRELFELWPKAWQDLKNGGTARPTSAPEAVETKLVAAAPVEAFASYELRCLRVRPLGPPVVEFVDGDST